MIFNMRYMPGENQHLRDFIQSFGGDWGEKSQHALSLQSTHKLWMGSGGWTWALAAAYAYGENYVRLQFKKNGYILAGW